MNLFGQHRKSIIQLYIYFPLIYFSCAIINLCLSSGLSALIVFVSFLCAILASAFYKYTTNRERILLNDNDRSVTHTKTPDPIDIDSTDPLLENHDQTSDDTTEDFEEEIEMKPIENIYHLITDNDLTCTDFINQLKMYGFQINDEIDIELS